MCSVPHERSTRLVLGAWFEPNSEDSEYVNSPTNQSRDEPFSPLIKLSSPQWHQKSDLQSHCSVQTLKVNCYNKKKRTQQTDHRRLIFLQILIMFDWAENVTKNNLPHNLTFVYPLLPLSLSVLPSNPFLPFHFFFTIPTSSTNPTPHLSLPPTLHYSFSF